MSTMTTKTVKAGFLREGDVMVHDASDLFGGGEMHVWFDVVTRTEEQGWEGNSIFLIHVKGGGATTTKQHHEVQVLGNTKFSDDMKESITSRAKLTNH
jgi:hypothetical protein